MSEALPVRSSHFKDIAIAVLVSGILAFTQGIKWSNTQQMQRIGLTTPTTAVPAPAAPAPK